MILLLSIYSIYFIGAETIRKTSECGFDDEESEPLPKRFRPSESDDSSNSDRENDQEKQTTKISSSPEELKDVQVSLEGRDLWERFNELGTEMIITKSGR